MADDAQPGKSKKRPNSEVQKWLGIIKSYETEFKPWETRVDKILKRYRDEKRQDTSDNPPSRFNILWANVQTLVPATFARLPQPDVSRRFSDRDPVGRVAAMILERALDFEVQHYRDYRSTMKQSVTDRFLGGRGTSWARYEPHIKTGAEQSAPEGDQITEDTGEQLDYECAPVDYVHWKDFGHTVARTWEEVTAVWRKVYMTRDACVARFGEKKGNAIPLDATPEDMKRSEKANPELDEQKRACVYEIWDKENEEAVWLSKSQKDILDRKDDPLGLEDFFPCPKPLFATMTNESLIPVPDFTLYQDQANELDVCSDRIDGLLKALQVRGVYDASQGVEIARLFSDAGNTDLRPIKNWQAFAEKNGLKGAIDLVDLKPIADALKESYTAMEQIKNQVYEITGISDIIRGQTEASETATAQQLKGQYASLRLKALQQDVAQYATELLRLKAQIVSGFDPQTLMQIASVDQLAEADRQHIIPALQMLADKPLRNFRIDIAADSMVQIDEEAEKEDRVEFLTAVGTYIGKAAEVGAAAPMLVPLLMELLKFGVTGFKVGKSVEGTIDQALEQMKQQAAQPQQQRPDPEMAKVEIERQKAQVEAERGQQQMALEQEKASNDMNLQREKQAFDQQMQREQMERDMMLKDTMHQREMSQRETEASNNTVNDVKSAFGEHQNKVGKMVMQAQHERELGAVTQKQEEKAQSQQQGQDAVANVQREMQELAKSVQTLIEQLGRPKRIVRGPDGRASGVETVQ
jgi:hypothetical protein